MGWLLGAASQRWAMLTWKDESCTNPAIAPLRDGRRQVSLSGASYAGDGHGDGIDRVREGYVEMIEMAALTGASAVAVTHEGFGSPADCGAATIPFPSSDL